jgi:hypothetical protein
MARRPITPVYVLFYIMFLPDAWQALFGVIGSCLISPQIIPADFNPGGKIMAFFMIATIIYAAARPVGKWVSNSMKKFFLGNKAK